MLGKKLFRTAWKYKAQFISMVIMVALGMGIFLGFNAEWKTIEVDVGSFFSDTKFADFRIYSDEGFSKDDVDALLKKPEIKAATRFFDVNADLKGTNKALSLNISENYTVSTMQVTSGIEYDDSKFGLWLSDKFADKNGISVGDNLELVINGIDIKTTIVGLAKCSEHMICVADSNQLMPDYSTFGFAYTTPKKMRYALGMEYYPQINIISDVSKERMEEIVKDTLGKTYMVVPKEDNMVYAEAKGEENEGKSMGNMLPVIFLAIAILTMITTMHRITANEKTQIGTLKALGYRNSRILWHYTSYGLVIAIIGCAIGVGLGIVIAKMIMSPGGMMGTYFDMPDWSIHMPVFCYAALAFTIVFLTFISFLSVKSMLKGTAADALRPYTPKKMKKLAIERTKLWDKLSFGTHWNMRDILRHKSRSAMTLLGVVGCMILLVGGLGMKDTMDGFLSLLGDDISNYNTKINLVAGTENDAAFDLAEDVNGDWEATSGISIHGKTVTLQVYGITHDNYRFIDVDNNIAPLSDDGAYVCMRLADEYKVGDTVEISPYGSNDTYKVKIIGVRRSIMTENIVLTQKYADKIGIPYSVTSIYTDRSADSIEKSDIIAGKQSKQTIMDTYDSFMEIMNFMIYLLVLASCILGVVVLYNLGIMSYVERYRELATLKVLGFRDRQIGGLLISQNVWLTIIGVIIGLPCGVGVLQLLLDNLAGEYELKLMLGVLTYTVSIAVTFGVSLVVGLFIARHNKKIDMVEALKIAE